MNENYKSNFHKAIYMDEMKTIKDLNEKVNDLTEKLSTSEKTIQTLNNQVTDLSGKLLKSHENMVKSITEAEDICKKKSETRIKELEAQLLKEKIDKENALSSKKEIEKILKKVKETTQKKLKENIAEKVAQFDYTPKILELCSNTDSILGLLVELNSICLAQNRNLEYVSQQRIYGTIENLKNILEELIINSGIEKEIFNKTSIEDSTSSIPTYQSDNNTILDENETTSEATETVLSFDFT